MIEESPLATLEVPCVSRPVPDTGRVMISLIQAARAVEKRIEEALEKVELSRPKYSALKHLVLANEPLALSDLAERLTCVRSNITQLVDRLEADGLVRRVEDPRDRRSVRAALTTLGRERQAAGAERIQTVESEVEKILSQIDRATLERALAALQ